MAKLDFCFTFYDGDATRETAHMNRLERGAYYDVLIQLRQRRRLSIDDIKKFLSRDFEAVWPALEWILKKDEDGYYIEWLENSIQKSTKHSKKQSDNIKIRYQKEETTYQSNDLVVPKNNLVIPLGDGYGIEKKEGVQGEKEKHVLSDLDTQNTVEFCAITLQRTYTTTRIRQLWDAFLIQNGGELYNKPSDRIRHFRNWIKTQPYETETMKKPPPGSHTPPSAEEVMRRQEEERKRDRERVLSNLKT